MEKPIEEDFDIDGTIEEAIGQLDFLVTLGSMTHIVIAQLLVKLVLGSEFDAEDKKAVNTLLDLENTLDDPNDIPFLDFVSGIDLSDQKAGIDEIKYQLKRNWKGFLGIVE